jgi:hypothetical protein
MNRAINSAAIAPVAAAKVEAVTPVASIGVCNMTMHPVLA